MKKTIILSIGLFAFTNKTEEKTAQLRFTQQQYEAVKGNFIDAFNKVDSIKIALNVMGASNGRINTMLDVIKSEMMQNGNFIFQIDSVFKK